MNKDVVVFGTGGAAEKAISALTEKGFCVKAVFDRSSSLNEERTFFGHKVQNESRLEEFLSAGRNEASVIIASSYFDNICDRFVAEGIDLSVCYAPNFYKTTPYHSGNVIPFSDKRYCQLEQILEDKPSKELLHYIMNHRGEKAPDILPIAQVRGFGGSEDYWRSIKPHRMSSKAIILDCGAYIGDSVSPLCNRIGPGIVRYYAFEPIPESYEQLLTLPKIDNQYGELIAIPKAVWSSETVLKFDFQRDSSSVSSTGTLSVDTQVIDNLNLEDNADIFIKMDIEGSEMDALRGAENLIRKNKPSLAICLYHKENDLFEIPLYLKSLVPQYNIYLCGGSHTICIAQV